MFTKKEKGFTPLESSIFGCGCPDVTAWGQKPLGFLTGFTLIELLVVIAIIGLLSSLSLTSLTGARLKAYDAQIKSDIAQLRTGIEIYADDRGGIYDVNGDSWHIPVQFQNIPTCSADKDFGYQKNVTASSYIIFADLCSINNKDFCADSTGYVGVVDSLNRINQPFTCVPIN